MYSKAQFFISLNLLFYILFVNGCGTCNNPSSPTHKPPINGSGGRNNGGSNNGGGNTGGGNNGGGNNGGGSNGGGNNGGGRCPRDALKLGVCADVLGLINNVVIGSPPTVPCCSVLEGLLDLEAAICLCTAIRANILGINLNIPVSLSLVLDACARTTPPGFVC